MYLQHEFVLYRPKIICQLSLFLIAIFIIILFVCSFFKELPHEIIYFCVTVFIFIPFSLLAVWAKMFRIKIINDQIQIRKCFGIINNKYTVNDITKVEWRTMETIYGINELITIFFIDNKKIKIETLMINSDKMKNYIEQNVSTNKIYRNISKINYK